MADTKQKADVSDADVAHVDRVYAVSRHADGTPAQSPGWQSVHPEATAQISEHQLREMAASAVDYAARTAALAEQEGDVYQDPWIKSLKDEQEKAADAAAKKVEKPSK